MHCKDTDYRLLSRDDVTIQRKVHNPFFYKYRILANVHAQYAQAASIVWLGLHVWAYGTAVCG